MFFGRCDFVSWIRIGSHFTGDIRINMFRDMMPSSEDCLGGLSVHERDPTDPSPHHRLRCLAESGPITAAIVLSA
jgi:hypothetical protein